jgi:hypothetical protein
MTGMRSRWHPSLSFGYGSDCGHGSARPGVRIDNQLPIRRGRSPQPRPAVLPGL